MNERTTDEDRDAVCGSPLEAVVSWNCSNCHECLRGKSDPVGFPVISMRMIVCPVCGNKRCPKATDLECTGSNEPGQPGSVYS